MFNEISASSGYSSASDSRRPGSILSGFLRDLWWSKWHFDRLFSFGKQIFPF